MEENIPEKLRSLAERVLAAYQQGRPVVLFDKEGNVLHGKETLEVVAQTGARIETLRIGDIDRQEFETSDLPELCEAARQVWLEDKFGDPRT